MGRTTVFTAADRESLREELVERARADPRIAGAALLGSAALDREDRWSDIDLALSLSADAPRAEVVSDWSDGLYEEHGAAHHVDVVRPGALYRVFLLADTLQVDISFWTSERFGARGPGFRLLFGTASEEVAAAKPTAGELIGMGWLWALHARSSIERDRPLQAEYMISAMRDGILALACLRHDLPVVEARGADSLSEAARAPFEATLVRSLESRELRRAFGAAVEAFLVEAERADPALGKRLAGPVRLLVD